MLYDVFEEDTNCLTPSINGAKGGKNYGYYRVC